MRKALLTLAICLLLIFTILIVTKGLHKGNIDIWGINDISEKNDEIDAQNAKLTSLVNSNYSSALSKLNTSSETLQETKKQYEEKEIALSQNKNYKQKEHYKHEFILVKIGNYAEENNVDIRLVVTESATTDLYDLNFTITGKYADVASFIYDIENDSSLGFKIENFVEVSAVATATREDGTTYTTNAVKANFYAREVSIDLKWLDENEAVVPGIITRGNPFITNTTKLTGKYKNETLEGQKTTGNSTGDGTSTGTGDGNSTDDETGTANPNGNGTGDGTGTANPNGNGTGDGTGTANPNGNGTGDGTSTANPNQADIVTGT